MPKMTKEMIHLAHIIRKNFDEYRALYAKVNKEYPNTVWIHHHASNEMYIHTIGTDADKVRRFMYGIQDDTIPAPTRGV